MAKSQLDTILNWTFFKIAIITFVIAFFIIILTNHYNTSLSSRDIQNVILSKRLIYSLLAYVDSQTQRPYPGIIDDSKFDTSYLENRLINNNGNIAANMELENIETGETKKAYINEKRARAWDDYVNLGGFDMSSTRRFVYIYKDGKFYQGILKMYVISKE